ncbi:sensor histidine kinase [bacterium]|nr:MAG: sensor histidine kinase [bacterium]
MPLSSSLNVKINVAIAAALVIVLGVSAYLTLSEQNRQAEENTKAKARLLTQAVTNIIRMDMESQNEKDLEKIIKVLGQFREIETLRIFSADGLILHSADSAETGSNIDELVMNVFMSGDMSKPFRSGVEDHRSMCRVEVMKNEPQCHRCHGKDTEIIGVLEVCLSMAAMDAQIERNARFMVISTLLTILVVSLCISLLTTAMVNRPISSLMSVMRKAQSGKLADRVELRSNDELGKLSESFNEMLSRLEIAENEMKRLHAEQMSRAERLASIGEMAASVAHEIKNPLAGLSGATQVLAGTFKEDDPRNEVLREMLKLTGRLDKTINDLLNFARVKPPEFGLVNPNDIIEEVLFFAGRDSRETPCEFVRKLDPRMMEIPLDSNQIQQVFLNLVINARQASKPHGKITVSSNVTPKGPLPDVVPHGEYVEVSISDEGSGISPEVVAEMFKPFYTTKVQGTGLGLSISRNIIESHGGIMGVVSKEGEGTTFFVWLRKNHEEVV